MSESELFSDVLREDTRPVPGRGKGYAYIDALLAGELTLAGFAELAAQNCFIYTALEAGFDTMRTDPVAGTGPRQSRAGGS